MERDVFIGHGAAMTLKERLLDESDREFIHVCANCGMSAVENVEQRRVYRPNCDGETDIHEIEMSYAFKPARRDEGAGVSHRDSNWRTPSNPCKIRHQKTSAISFGLIRGIPER